MMFGQASRAIGRWEVSADDVSCLDQCDALAMHRDHAKLGLPCQSASPAIPILIDSGAGGYLTVTLIEIGADLRSAGNVGAFLRCS